MTSSIAVAEKMTDSPDDALIKQILGGDKEQFALLVIRHQQRVLRFILKYEHNVDDAEDLAQETFLQAFRTLSSFNYQSRFSTWLTGIAFNLIKNHINRTPTKRYAHVDIDEQQERIGAITDNLAEEYEHSQMLAAMAQAFDALPVEMRDAMALVVSAGLNYEEAAATLGVPIGTLKSRLCRARLQLTDTLGEYRLY
jgi:RNA polymerase sigma-70 factor (ECF subfamily)